MGTLLEQRIRYEVTPDTDPEDVMERVKNLMERHELSFEQAMLVLEEAREDTWRNFQEHDLDAKDEQLAGFGELLQELIRVVGVIGEARQMAELAAGVRALAKATDTGLGSIGDWLEDISFNIAPKD